MMTQSIETVMSLSRIQKTTNRGNAVRPRTEKESLLGAKRDPCDFLTASHVASVQ